MGICLSCDLIPSQPTSRVYDTHGVLKRVELPVNAAELMLEYPGNVVCVFNELERTRRIVALRADEELQGGMVYFMFSIGRVYCKVTESEMEVIVDMCCKKKGLLRGLKVFPLVIEALGEGEEGANALGCSILVLQMHHSALQAVASYPNPTKRVLHPIPKFPVARYSRNIQKEYGFGLPGAGCAHLLLCHHENSLLTKNGGEGGTCGRQIREAEADILRMGGPEGTAARHGGLAPGGVDGEKKRGGRRVHILVNHVRAAPTESDRTLLCAAFAGGREWR
ncbi:hypothetical protein GIB67_039720 [Kingdonia uniflora]|uniref:Uncharacterized protein n=1 Tax=Kingdonia uniflora TaxID=39325 RepID=A0A7J7MPU6_9MAGN|nr:hypothetical protein GIB67_039720 [Kingdonia uniflora]